MRRGEAQRRIEAEIIAEKAQALGRAGERLEETLRAVAAIVERVHRAPTDGARERLAREYERARAHALRARTALLIQREAIGLRRHAAVDQQFPEPPPFGRIGRP
jgi:hypothetical protein